jgi:hypothetical protein
MIIGTAYLLSLHDQVVVDEFDCVSVAAGRMRLGERRLTMMKRAGKKRIRGRHRREANDLILLYLNGLLRGGQRFGDGSVIVQDDGRQRTGRSIVAIFVSTQTALPS